jgi:hypothetical protein
MSFNANSNNVIPNLALNGITINPIFELHNSNVHYIFEKEIGSNATKLDDKPYHKVEVVALQVQEGKKLMTFIIKGLANFCTRGFLHDWIPLLV